MLGKELSQFGKIIDNKELTLVHIELKEGEKVPAHNHIGQDVFFTLVKGKVEVTLDGTEVHTLTPGTVLNFDGEVKIGVLAVENSEFFAYLVNKR